VAFKSYGANMAKDCCLTL